MSKTTRLLFQVIMWIFIWLALWFAADKNPMFFQSNVVAFCFQIVLIAGLIYYAAPALLFKKKYWFFVLISVLALGVSLYFASNFFQSPPIPRPENLPKLQGNEIEELTRRPPPGGGFLIHLLLLSISYSIATFLETFIFAQKKEEEIIINKNEGLQSELKFLKSQINPHFLFNSLNNIYALSAIDTTKTQQSISYLSNMLRYVLYECDKSLVSISKEITYIENYINLFSLKSSEKYPITLDAKIEDPNVSIAPMLLIPFVENAFKHSNIDKRTSSFINISIVSNTNEISFKIENSKPERPMNKDDVGGIGINNVKKRLSILYPETHTLLITDTAEVYKVELQLHV
ncbi:histidine kinase [Gillisia sp. Hel_I_86]|uniref:sensor histidine kinase n=1 Tax=Gillisia sp. Hel_I_86 TaxID=1249981 RepID=UPI001199AD4D|nr:histidine kinase [Gillisia sp. Hel_I_86]TVZ27945.1 histidine kinase [Gillisia sp. Hel_I_86]